MKFRHIDLKTGIELSLPVEKVENTYLELKIGKENQNDLAVGKIYDGITEEDIERLKEQGLHLILTNGKNAYFSNEINAERVKKEIFTNQSDAVAYGGLPVSEAKKSVYKEQTKILIIDDESLSKDLDTGIYSADWGEQKISLSSGITLSDKAMGAIASKLGDCYSLISPELARQLEAETNRPFQFRAGVPEWEGMMKGTCRTSVICQALEVDAIIAKSSIKGDGKNTTTGMHDVSLFWSRKEDAKYGEQKLGTQVLVLFPEGVKTEILPKLKIRAEELAEAQSDPRKIAELYIKRHENRQQLRQESNREKVEVAIEPELAKELGLNNPESISQEPQIETANTKEYKDWLYEVLKTDLVEGGHCQVIEMEDVIKRLRKFVQSEWQDIATGGIYVPSGVAQPHNQLSEGEVSFNGLPHGAKVGIYRSPVANAANFDVFTNNIEVIKNKDPEAYMQQGVCYMNPNDAKRLVVDFDGDRVGIIPGQLTPEQQASTKKAIEQYPNLITEIISKNLPEHKPVQVEKEKKIPRDLEHGFGSLASAAINAADNPTGRVANLGMKLEALRWETQYISQSEKSAYLENIAKHFQKLVKENSDTKKPFKFLNAEWERKISEISEIQGKIKNLPESEKNEAVEKGLAKTERLIWDLESISAINLQRAVDTPKSARKVDENEFVFCQKVTKYKEVEWIKDKESKSAYLQAQGIKTNTQDPVGWMVEQANQTFRENSLIGDRNYNRFDHIFPKDSEILDHSEWAKNITKNYNALIADAIKISNMLEHEEGISISATSDKGNRIEIVNVASTNLDGNSPIWELTRNKASINIEIAQNDDWKTKDIYPYKAVSAKDGKFAIGLISPVTIEAYGEKIRTGAKFADLKLDFILGLSKDDVDKKFKEAELYLEGERASIPEAEINIRAAAMWNNNSRAIAGKMFTDEVTTQLQELRIDKLKVIGLQYDTNEVKNREWEPDRSINLKMGLESNPESPIFNKRVIQVEDDGKWKNMGVLNIDAAYMPIGSMFTGNISLSNNNKEADIQIAPDSLKLPEIWQGLTPERVQKAVNLDEIVPKLKEAIAKAADNNPTMTDFVKKLAEENVGVKAQVHTGGKINGITYLFEGQAVKASNIEMSWKNLSAMGVKYDPVRDREALTTSNVPTIQQPKPPLDRETEQIDTNIATKVKTNPLNQIEDQLRSSVLSHFGKDKAMAEIATQFIGKAATPEGVYSSTKLYEQAWGEVANTGKYKVDDVIMVSGSGPWKREGDERTKPQIEQDIHQVFDSHYKPLLDQAIAAGSQILVGNAKGTDQLVMDYMKEKGYILDWQPQGYFQVSAKQREQSDNPEQQVKISGKPVQMVYPLKMHGEINPLPVNSCIEAMRGFGRTHTTRRFEPYAAYNFKEGDIAIAYAGEKKVAFEVGKQYKIPQEKLKDVEYQKEWANMEKHGGQELLTFVGHENTWGMNFKPLGDYVDGKIVAFQTEKSETNSIASETAKLESWKEIAEYLGKSENYVNRIQEIIAGENLSEKAQKAMSNDRKTLGEQVASKWRKILAMKSDFLRTEDGKVTFERKGKEGKYRAAWEQSSDTLTVDAKIVDQDNIKYKPLLVQVGLEVTKNQISVADAQNVERALKVIDEKNKVYQEQR